MPISCESCREALHSHLADLIETKNGEAPTRVPVWAQTAAAQEDTALSSTQRSEIEAHLAQCPSCTRELALLRGLTAELHNLPSLPAPPDLRARIRSQLANEVHAVAQPDIAQEQKAPSRNSLASWSQSWRDFWRRPARVAWAGVALTGFLLLLATQTNVPFPSSQPDSATAPSLSPPAAIAPSGPPQNTVRQIQRKAAPRLDMRNTSRSPAQRATSPAPNGNRSAPATQPNSNDVPNVQAPQAAPAQQPRASTRNTNTGGQKAALDAGVKETPAQDTVAQDTVAPSAASPAVKPRHGPSSKVASKPAPRAMAPPNFATSENTLPARDASLFARLQVQGRAEQPSLREVPALGTDPESSALATAPAPLRKKDAAATLDSQNSNNVTGGASASGGAGPPGVPSAPDRTAAFSVRRRNAASADAAPEGVQSAPGEQAQRATAGNRQKTTPEAERIQRTTSGDASTTRSQSAAESRGSTDAGSVRALRTPTIAARVDAPNVPRAGDAMTTARLVVTPPRDVTRARLRVVGSTGIHLSQNGVTSQMVWTGTARRGQEIVVALRLRTAAPGTLRVILEEAHGGGWKTVREQILSLPSR
ncbi:MAG TPA: hypothetical protein VF600_04010 [Abditibacteriaceae bacterium]|jgi:hypothetical protein